MTPVEKNTNQLYRQKYYVDTSQVFRNRPTPAAPLPPNASTSVIPGSSVRLSKVRVPMNKPAPPENAPIAVRVVRTSPTVSEIRIDCPCGRHAELDLDSAPRAASGSAGGGLRGDSV
jgi:hypothetical protein